MKENQSKISQTYATDDTENKVQAEESFYDRRKGDFRDDVFITFPVVIILNHIEFRCPDKG